MAAEEWVEWEEWTTKAVASRQSSVVSKDNLKTDTIENQKACRKLHAFFL